MTNQHRDTLAMSIAQSDLLMHIATCENESKARVKYQLLRKMIQPCGPPPVNPEEQLQS